ncbi:MAG: DUF4123 domain-containing protein [Pseudomonadota bacterium]
MSEPIAFAASAVVDGAPLPCVALAATAQEAVSLVEARLFEHGVIGTVTAGQADATEVSRTVSPSHPVSFGSNILRLPVRSRGMARSTLPNWLVGIPLDVAPLGPGDDPAAIPPALRRLFKGPGTVYAVLSQRPPEGMDARSVLAEGAATGPWLVPLAEGPFRRALFTAGPDPEQSFWDDRPGLLIRSQGTAADVAARLRRLPPLRPATADADAVAFAFWDAALLRMLLPYLEPEDAEALLGGDTFVPLGPSPQVQVALANPPLAGGNAPPARFRMKQTYVDAVSRAESDAFRSQLVAEILSLKPALTAPEAERFADLGLDVCASVGLQQPDTISGYTMLSVLMGWDMTQRYAVAAPILDLKKPEAARKTLILHLLGRVATRT